MIYLDYAATSYRKPQLVYRAVYDALRFGCANPGRGGHTASLRAGEIVFSTREKLAEFFSAKKPECFAFFPNTTAALNAGIKGVLRRGDHVVLSSMEHNSVMRPLEALKRQGIIRYDIVQAGTGGKLSPADFANALLPQTRLVICTHASNVCGNIYDISAISRLVRRKNTLFMVDAAQSAGSVPLLADRVDLLAFPGHKGLYGPQGTGALYVRDGLLLAPLIEGGTGTNSELLTQPEEMPERLESGTLNVPAVCGLGAALDFVMAEGVDAICAKEKMLMEILRENVKNLPQITVYGDDSSHNVLAFNIANTDATLVADYLNDSHQIAVRSGLHCAPFAHDSLGTLSTGCVRISLGYFTTKREIDAVTDALYHFIQNQK